MRIVLLLLALALAACSDPEPTETQTGNEEDRPLLQIDDLERRIHDAVNDARRAEGLDAYGWRAELSRVARDHSCDMVEQQFFEHVAPDGGTPTDRAGRRGISCRTEGADGQAFVGVSENLFRTALYSGYSNWTQGEASWRTYDWQSADDIALATVEGWLNSPPHRRAMLDPSSEDHGIGVCIGDADEVLVTQVMC